MADRDFNDINDMIEKAINAQNYNDLSDSIRDLVSDAVSGALGEIGENMNDLADYLAGRKIVVVDRRADYLKNKTHSKAATQNPWMDEFDKMAWNHFTGKDLPETQLYSTGGLSRIRGYLYTILGFSGAAGCVAGILAFLVLSVFGLGTSVAPLEIFLIILGVLFGMMAKKGIGIISKLGRFKNYIKAIGKKASISIRELAGASGKSEKDTLKDVQEMLKEDMFLQGHLDQEMKNLYVTDSAFAVYEKELKEKLAKEYSEAEQKRIMEHLKEQRAKGVSDFDVLNPDLEKLLTAGEGYVDMFKDYNRLINDPVVSERLSGLEMMTSRIFEYVKENPKAAAETKKLMKYYLPTTQKLLESYQKLNEAEASGLHPDQIPNIRKSKKEIEETLQTLNTAFARLFDNLYQDTSMDIRADISVLQSLLAQEGLVGEDIKKQEVSTPETEHESAGKQEETPKTEEQGQVLQTY